MEQALLESAAGVSTHQSRAFVHIFLNASIACILYTRRLIDWDSQCFATRSTSQLTPGAFNNVTDAYAHFSSPRFPPRSPSDSGQEFKILRSGGHRCADQVLNLLSQGVMNALDHSYLNTLKLLIWGQIAGSSSVIETYTFVFEVSDIGQLMITTAETGEVLILTDLQKSFKKAIISLLRSTRALPKLPKSGRRMSFNLVYSEACPLSYQPCGFIEADSSDSATWADLGQLKQAARFESYLGTVTVSIQHCDREVGRDHLVSNQLNALQRTSSRNPHITLTMDQPQLLTIPSGASKLRSQKSVVDLADEMSSISAASRACGAGKRMNSGQADAQRPQKTSIARHMVQFSSSSGSTAAYDSDGDEFR